MNECVSLKSAVQATPEWAPFRPVQYLGSKLRVLPEIRDAALSLAGPGASIVDLFTGTTVVSQQLAFAGARVTAVDMQRYAQIFGAALLGVGRGRGEGIDPGAIIESALEHASGVSNRWKNARESEAHALDLADAAGLRKLYDSLPLVWREGGNDQSRTICTVYAGTYFGVRQAIEIDALLSGIHGLVERGFLSEWQRAVALTGLMHAASLAVHSAGKHFAQPLGHRVQNAKFLDSRLVSDRGISVFDCFAKGCQRTLKASFNAIDCHTSLQAPAEEFALGRQGKGHQLFYLDPPYTAQQYSRFYHVLETIADGGSPKLPTGTPLTTGLYPVGRYKSAFSSRRLAPQALEAVIDSIAQNGAAALISYSSSAIGSDGNARMISLKELLSICSNAFGTTKVECSKMPHRYRQFNSSANSNNRRDDSEILILCKSA